MPFGKKKKKVEEPTVDLEVEVPEIEPKEETVVEPVKETKEEPVEEIKEEEETKATAQIVSGEILENGLHRYIILSNAPIGKIGDIEEL